MRTVSSSTDNIIHSTTRTKAIGITELNRALIDELIESIIVYDGERIEIKMKHLDEISDGGL